MKNLKELASFGIELGHTYDIAMLDKKFELSDLMLFIPVILKSQEAFKDIKEISSEWKAASFAQKMSWSKEIEQELNLSNEKVEKIIEASIVLLVQIDELIKLIKG
jgi:hypothetical protein